MAERDIHLKLKMQEVLWRLGCYTRVNVKLSTKGGAQGPEGRRQTFELSDIDVLGVSFGLDYSVNWLVADCTTRSRVSPVGRAFWLRGVMDHFAADQGYAIVAKPLEEHERQVAAKLGITLLARSDLDGLEGKYGVDPLAIRLGDESAYSYIEGNVEQVRREFLPLLEWRKHEYWLRAASRNLLRAISLTRAVSDLFDPRQRFHRVLFFDVLSLFALCVLQMAAHVFHVNPEDLRGEVRRYLFGGSIGVAAKEALLKDVSELLESVPGQRSLLPNGDIRDKLRLDPTYLDPLAELTLRLSSRPRDAVQIPRYLQALMIERIAYDGSRLKDIFGDDYSQVSAKLANDLARLFLEATGVDGAIVQDLPSLLE